MGLKDKFRNLEKKVSNGANAVGKTVYSGAKDFGYGFYSNVNDIKKGVDSKLEERNLRMENARKLEDILSESGSSVIPLNTIKYNPQVSPNSIWVNPDVLKRLSVDNGDAVLLLEEITDGKNKYYPLRGPFKIEAHEKIGPTYTFMNDVNSPQGGVYVEFINPVYLAGEFRGKIEKYFKLDDIYVSRGPGIMPMSYAKKLADSYDFPRPKDGTVVPMMTYNGNGEINGIYQAEVSVLGNKFQVPTDINLNEVYSLGVYLGLTDKFVRRKML
ncbi:hypothetical protein IHE50_00630 [Candidatus Parvarchaeota archaeon]|uniref:Uncharacterized protein n=1 Tax=Candidatus Acidifodinimicrobium mancum TaxID=2898728 RepID=A0A8T3UTT6_9ARCH|nr:hypothetical protein [Candidatus Acidifodinimicrobium mancum]